MVRSQPAAPAVRSIRQSAQSAVLVANHRKALQAVSTSCTTICGHPVRCNAQAHSYQCQSKACTLSSLRAHSGIHVVHAERALGRKVERVDTFVPRVLWVPPQPLAPSLACRARDDILQQARYLARRFPQRAWIAVELLRGPHDGVQLDALRELSARSGLPPDGVVTCVTRTE